MRTHPTSGSTFIVKPYDPWRRWVSTLLILLALAGAGWLLHELGVWRAGFDNARLNNSLIGARADVDQLRETVEDLRERLAIAERGGQVDKQANEIARSGLKELQDELLELKEELAFYRGIVAPDEERSGIRIERMRLSGALPKFRYNLMLTQVLKSAKQTSGQIEVNFDGLQNGALKSYSLKELSKKPSTSFKFKYFQNLEGELTLPNGFTPSGVNIEVVPQNKRADRVTKSYEWADVVQNVIVPGNES